MALGTLNIAVIKAAAYRPGRTRGIQAIIVHSVESDIKRIARSLAGGMFASGSSGTSAHTITDPFEAIEMVAPEDTAWAVGNGNPQTWNQEHAGRAAMSTARWLADGGDNMLRISAQAAAIVAVREGIPARWLSVVQLARGEKGFATHNDCRLAFGGTTHTDPGPGFPYDKYMSYVRAAMDGNTPLQKDGFLMALTDEQQGSLYSALLNDAKPGVSNIQYILDSLGTLMKDHAELKQGNEAMAKVLNDLQSVVWAGGPGTPAGETIGQRLKRVEGEAKK